MPRQLGQAPGPGWLMWNAAMRELDKRSKNNQRRSRTSGSFNRPRFVHLDGQNYKLDPALYGDQPATVHPHSQLKLLLRNNPNSPDWVPDGLARDPVYRRFEYDRSQWRRQGFTSPYKFVSDRKVRYEGDFNLWLYWHPHREKLEEELYLSREYPHSGRPGDHRHGGNHENRRGGPPILDGRGAHGRGQQRYPWQSYDHDQGRPSYRGRQIVDIRDPRNRPPPPTEILDVFGDGMYEGSGGRDGPARIVREVPLERDIRAYPRGGLYGISGDGSTQRRRRHDGIYLPRRGREHVRVYNGYVPGDDYEPPFLPRGPALYPNDEVGEDLEEEDATSQYSNISFERRRLSPQIFYPTHSPYHGRPLGHSRRNGRHELDEDEFELFRRRAGHMGIGRGRHGVGREGTHFRPGRRSYGDEGLDYGFSGDEDVDYDL